MTVLDELVKAMRFSPCRYSPDSHPKEWPLCASGKLKHPECAVAAVLRALPKSEAVRVATTGMLSRNTLDALARLADE